MIIEVEKYNETYAILKCDRGIAQELNDYFAFFATGYKFMPSYKSRLWDGKIRLAKILPNGDVEFFIGLLQQLEAFCTDRDYSLQYNYKESITTVTSEELHKFVTNLNIHSNGKKIEVRDYQFKGVLDFLNSKRLVLLSPTSSGKSCILYIIVRYLLAQGKNKGLLLVPNTSLCHQLTSDFADYSSHNGWDVNKHIHMIFAGQDKNAERDLYISTWQSLFNHKSQSYFNQFDFVLCDEAHLAAANSLTGIVQKSINADYRLGVTGTLNGQKIHSLQLESIFGPVRKVISTKELMDKKQVTKLNIKCIVLKYPEEITKYTQKLKYQQELEYLISNDKRNKFIKNLVLSLKGNSLLLFQYVDKHGEVLFDLISNSKYAIDKKVYFIHGGIKAEERETIRKAMETEDNVILIGSVGTVSTGTNIKNLHNIIFAAPSKSRIRNLQAIGRVLRLNENKQEAVLYDISDDLRYKKHQNYTLTHFQERVKIYNEEKFDFKIINVDMGVL
jgi:superfamily II DNA or RNA helicase